MATKLIPFIIKYKTKKIKPGERVIRAKNSADAIARLKNDVEGLVKIEEPRLASPKELEMRRMKRDKESIAQIKPKYSKMLSKPMTAKRSKSQQKISTDKTISKLHDSVESQPILESLDVSGIKNDLISLIEEIILD